MLGRLPVHPEWRVHRVGPGDDEGGGRKEEGGGRRRSRIGRVCHRGWGGCDRFRGGGVRLSKNGVWGQELQPLRIRCMRMRHLQ